MTNRKEGRNLIERIEKSLENYGFERQYIGSYYEYQGDYEEGDLFRSILFDSLEYMDLYVDWGDE